MKIGYVQTDTKFGEKEQNFQQVEELLQNVEADLIVLPELFATGYTFVSKEEAFKLSEEENGETAKFLMKIASLTGATMIGGFIEKKNEKIYNSALIVTKDRIHPTYRKIHLFNKEKLWFSPGNKGFEAYSINNVKIGVMICFDWIFPESARTLALKGAEIIAHPTNLVLPYCQKAMVTRCLENKVFGVTSNRIGIEKRGDDEFTFTGGSQITSPNGEILSSAPKNSIHIDFIEIDLELAKNKTMNEFNNIFKDRKEKYYL